MSKRDLLGLLSFIVLCFAAGLGGYWTAASVSPGGWDYQIANPSWTPSWLFGPLRTALYLAMAVAGWLVWRRGGWAGYRAALALFLIQLALNAIWSGLFFGLHSPSLAVIEILLLWTAILLSVLAFFRVSRLAGWLLVPYLLWVSLVSVGTFAVWRLNS
jgi:tryptophan-rich sensory protein